MTAPWLDDRIAANGKPVFENFANWFGKSKVTDALGQPQVVYHGTFVDFDEFKVSKDIGFHFGTQLQAQSIFGRKRNGRAMVAAYLNIENPLELRSDPRSWMPDYVVKHAIPGGVLSDTQKTRVLEAYENGLDVARSYEDGDWNDRLYAQTHLVHRNVLMPMLKELGYDGVVYKNEYEAKREKAHSWVAFESSQVKSAVSNSGLFLKDSTSITDSDAAIALQNASKAKLVIDQMTRTNKSSLQAVL